MTRIHIDQRYISGLAEGIHIGDKNFNHIQYTSGSQLTLKQFSKQTHEKVITEWRSTGTCEWLLNKSEFQRWAQSDNLNSFLWIYGFLERFREKLVTDESSDPFHLLYFYIGYGDDEQNRQLYKTMLMTFCEQFLDGDDATSSDVYESHSCDEIQHELNRSLATAERNVFIIIDALDQLPQEDRRKFLRGLNNLVQERKKEKNEFRLAIAISSRDCTGYDKLREHHLSQIHIRPSDNASDIQRYLEMKLDSDLFDDQPELREKALYELTNQADGMFLWAKLQAENICRINYEQDVLYTLETLILPGDMPKMYERYATGFEALQFQPIEKQIAVRTIALLSQTTGSIQKEILLVALALDIDSGKPNLDLYRLLRDEPARIVRDCKHLVDINEHLGVFRFCHMSIFEFFRSYKPAVSHGRVAQLCLAHLCLSDFSSGSHDDAEWFNYGTLRPVLQGYPFLEFASCNWAPSMRQSVDTSAELNIKDSHREILQLLEKLFAESSAAETWGNLRLSFQIFLLNHGRSITSGVCPDHIISYFALLEFFDIFSEKGWLNPMKRDREGLTAMHWAIRNEAKQGSGRNDSALVVEKLIELGGDMNARDNEGRTPLYYASHYGNAHVVTLFLERGAELNIPNNSNETPLIAACRKHHEEVISKLLSAEADIKVQGPDGTALQAMALIGCGSCAELIIHRYGEESIVEGKGPFSTSLHAAAFHGHAKVVHLLCEKGLDIHATDETYGSVLTAAVSGWNPIMDPGPFYEIIDRMISLGADINDPHGMWGPALRAAAFFGRVFSMALKAGNMAFINRLVGQYEMFVGDEVEKGRTPHLEGMINLAQDVFVNLLKMITSIRTKADVRSNRRTSKMHDRVEEAPARKPQESRNKFKVLFKDLSPFLCCYRLTGKQRPTSKPISSEKNRSLTKEILIADTWADILNHLLSHSGFGEPLLEKVLQNRTIELKRHLINPELELTERFKRAEGLARVGIELLLTSARRGAAFKRLSFSLSKLWVSAVNGVEDLGEQGQAPVREIIRIFSTRFSAAVRSRDRINAEICGQAGLEFVIGAALGRKRSLMDKVNEEWAKLWNLAVEADMDDLIREILNYRWEEYQKHITNKRMDKALGLAIAAMGTLGFAIQKRYVVVTQTLLEIINLGFRWTVSLAPPDNGGNHSEQGPSDRQLGDPNDLDIGRIFDATVNLFSVAEGADPNRLHAFSLSILSAIESASDEVHKDLKDLVLQRIQIARKGVHSPELSQYLIEISTTLAYFLNVVLSSKNDTRWKIIEILKSLTQALPKLTDRTELARYEHAIRFLRMQEQEALLKGA
ncbi:hypothetical protein F5Y11DRAFT_364739 [Daldinia sp. FL1419]|nr:hypothetical protein F5Y11DRAFT_364739 [Daldinia sp. FL1419]